MSYEENRSRYLEEISHHVVVRIIDWDDSLLLSAPISRAWSVPADLGTKWVTMPREGIKKGKISFKAPPRTAHASVLLKDKAKLPLWYGGLYEEDHLSFSLPSGLYNVWGQGNDFDVDSIRIHPDDIPAVIAVVDTEGYK